ncbi:MAG TPA: transporter substrate-binding domain-containing protein [Ktedonobacteraceae bacterium]|nr:transporter substrate-binding domain-containing protein [Ktedonobacteraceae bacterium]
MPRITPTPTPPVSPPNDLVTSGMLTVGSDTNLPPQSYVDANGHPTGFDIDLITAIAQQMGLTVNVVSVGFDQLISDLNNKMFDVVISAYPLTAKVQNQVQSVPYLKPADVLLVSKANPVITTFKHLTDLCGHTIGVLAGSNEDNTLKAEKCSQGTSITLDEFQSVDDVADALEMGKVDAIYQDSPTSVYYLSTNSKYNGKFKPVGSRMSIAQEGILIRTGDMAMDASIQSAFAMVMGDMKYTQLLQEWGLMQEKL